MLVRISENADAGLFSNRSILCNARRRMRDFIRVLLVSEADHGGTLIARQRKASTNCSLTLAHATILAISYRILTTYNFLLTFYSYNIDYVEQENCIQLDT